MIIIINAASSDLMWHVVEKSYIQNLEYGAFVVITCLVYRFKYSLLYVSCYFNLLYRGDMVVKSFDTHR